MNENIGLVQKEGNIFRMDRRVQKTRQLLKSALITLMSEKGFEAVTIQDILDSANVGRSTFYIHFENKQELLHACFEDFRKLFEEHNTSLLSEKKHSGDLKESDSTLNLFRFVERNRLLFKAILGKEGLAAFNQYLQDYIFNNVNKAIKVLAQNRKDPLQLDILAHYLTSAFIGTLKWWIDKDIPCSVDDLDRNFKKFALYDIRQVLG